MLNIGLVIKDIRKNLFFIIIFYIQLSISCFFILMSFTQLTNNFDLSNYLDTLKSKEIITFKSYFKESNIIENFDIETQKLLSDIYDEEKVAYSYLLSNRIEKYPERNVYIIVGSFNDIFDIGFLNSENNDIKAYLGHNISNIEINDEFNFGLKNHETVKFSNIMNKNSFFYHRNFRIDLDDSILLFIPYNKLLFLFGGIINEELIQNTNFTYLNNETLVNYMNIINNSKIINVIPYNSYDLYMENNKFSFYNNLFFFSFFMIFLIFTTFGIVINLITNIDNNLREYSIHMTYGATKLKIYMRIIMYTIFIILPITLFFSIFAYVSNMFGKVSFLQLCFIAILILLFLLVILLYPLSKLSNKNFSIFYRRDI